MSIALAQEIRRLATEVAELREIVAYMAAELKELQTGEPMPPVVPPEPVKRGPGRPRKVVAQ